MKAIYLEKPGVIIEKELPKPIIKDEEVLVQIKSVGICGSDVEYYETGRIGEFIVKKPIILGHEAAGLVTEIGGNVNNLQVGDRVTLEPGIPCRRCRYCKTGRYNLCPDVDFMATPPSDFEIGAKPKLRQSRSDGAFVEYVAHPADFAFKLPDSISYDEGALIEPLSVGIYAADRANIQPGDNVAILGAGPIGLVTLQAALVRGATEVVVTDVIDFRLEKATELGATETVNAKKDSIGTFFDKVIQTAGVASAYKQAMEIVGRGGRVVQVGHPSVQEVSIDPNLPITREFELVGSFRYANTYPIAISLLDSGKAQLKPIISKHFSFDEVEKALQYPKANPDKCIKAIVELL